MPHQNTSWQDELPPNWLQQDHTWPVGRTRIKEQIRALVDQVSQHESDDAHELRNALQALSEISDAALLVFRPFWRIADDPGACKSPYLANVVRSAERAFWEIVTTTRFNVDDVSWQPSIFKHEFTSHDFATEQWIALCILASVKSALEYADEWLQHPTKSLLDDVFEQLNCAQIWAAHLASVEHQKLHIAHQRSVQTRHVAELPRQNGKDARLTPKAVAQRVQEAGDQPMKTIVMELASQCSVSQRTVWARIKEAKEQGLLPQGRRVKSK